MQEVVFSGLGANTKKIFAMMRRAAPGLMVVFGVVIVVQSFLPFLRNAAQAYLINALVAHNNHAVIVGFGSLFGAGLGMSIVYTVGDYLEKRFWFLTEYTVQTAVTSKKITLDIATQEAPWFNDLFQRINDQLYRVQQFTFQYYFLISALIEVVTAIVVIGLASWPLTILLLVATVPELYIGARFGKEVWDIHASKAEFRRRFWDLQSHVNTLASVTELTLFQNARRFVSMISKLMRSFHDDELSKERSRLMRIVCAIVISYTAIGVALWVFVGEVLQGTMMIGTFIFMMASIIELRSGLSGLFRSLGKQLGDNNFVTDVFTFLEIKPSINYPKSGIRLPQNVTPIIRFDHVSFRYQGAARDSVHDVSLSIDAGEKIALVGVNGAGKTTFTKLICRLYDPTEGSLYLDGVNMKEVNINSWHSMLGVLFQQYAHYRFTVEESIAQGRFGEIDSAAIIKAATDAEAHSFISKYPDQYKQMLGREFGGGVEPSIGQWQKLALARVLYRNPRVYILDEPTASVDPEAEAHMFESLDQLPRDRTVISISHRFSTVRHADRIIVLDGGLITESGSHEKLMAKNGTYAKLFRLQAKGYQ